MLKNSIFVAIILLISTSCVSILSQMTDEDAWKNHFKEFKSQQQHENRSLASERAGVKILRQILDEMPFRNYLISCDSRDCFQSQLVLAFDQSFRRVKEQNINFSPEEYKTEQKYFLEFYSYENVLAWVETFHRMLLSGIELRAAQRAMNLAQTCETSLTSEVENHLENFAPFLGGTTYLPRSYYSCLNERWFSELDQLLKETTDRLGIVIKTNEAKRWILQKQISPIYKKTLNDAFSKRKQDEMVVWQQSWKEIESKIDWKKPREELIRDEVPQLRKIFYYINLEALLTEKVLSKK